MPQKVAGADTHLEAAEAEQPREEVRLEYARADDAPLERPFRLETSDGSKQVAELGRPDPNELLPLRTRKPECGAQVVMDV